MNNVEVNLRNLNYSFDGYNWYPLPYGKMYVKNCRLFGNVYSTRGGKWKWHLPSKCIVGYGEYNPYADFYFTGNLSVSLGENHFSTYYLRTADLKNRWLTFEGNFKPSNLWKVENILKNLNLTKWRLEVSARQGHLEIWTASPNYRLYDIKDTITKVFGRRKILNHQFFGDCRIYHIGNFNFVIIVSGITKVVSPDHLEEPILLREGVYIASHPAPSVNGVD